MVGKPPDLNKIVGKHETENKCKELSKALEIYTSQNLNDIPGFQHSFEDQLHDQRQNLERLKDPSIVPSKKFVDNSKLLQLAYLDKIIEECDEDQDVNRINEIVHKTHSFVDKQKQRIEQDNLRVDLDIHKDEDFEYQMRFDKSFYGKNSVKEVRQDQFHLRNKIQDTIGKQTKGISSKSPVFWISKSRPYSKIFLTKFPHLKSSKN